MKKTLMLSLVAVLALGIAGITWAAYPTADEPAAAIALEALESEVAPSASAVETLEAENMTLAADLESLFEESVEVADACCFVYCFEQHAICKSACGHDTGCEIQCWDELQECKTHC